MSKTETLPSLREDEHGVIPHENGTPSILDVIARAASDPRVDVTKMQALLDMQERIFARNAESAWNAALAIVQPKMPRITKKGRIEYPGKGGTIVSTAFARYEDIDLAVRPIYSPEGFSISWNTEASGSATTIIGTLAHKDGHSKQYRMTLPHDTSGSKNAIQAVGSTVSYGKRYLLCSMFNIVTVGEDDDGASSGAIDEQQKNRILDMLIHTNSDEQKFLKFMNVASVDLIQKRDFQRAIVALERKVKP